ncbi:MAG: heavy-metal-associated domain-containing protein [Tunicatimonas sp.]
METLKFKTNINCGGCVKAVTPKLNQVDSITSWQVDTDNPDKILEVQSQTGDQQPVIDAVKKSGFEIAPMATA